MSAPERRGDAGAIPPWGPPATGRSARYGPEDQRIVERQLARQARGVAAVAHRCPCGRPDVVLTRPRLEDGTPFPTLCYATCPRLTAALSTLEASGLMRDFTTRLAIDPEAAAGYRRAHEAYLARRQALGVVPELAGVSAGGMPYRVKCLHVLAAHALAAGPGENLFGDEVLAALPPWWEHPCAESAATVLAGPSAPPSHRPLRPQSTPSTTRGPCTGSVER